MNLFHVNNRRGALCLSQGMRMGYPACVYDARYLHNPHHTCRLLDCFIVLAWWLCDCQWYMRHDSHFACTLLWLADLNITFGVHKLQCILGSRYRWEFPPFLKATDSSVGLQNLAPCKETVEESSRYWKTKSSRKDLPLLIRVDICSNS